MGDGPRDAVVVGRGTRACGHDAVRAATVSADSATSAIVRTASPGYSPTAVSSDSINASVPSITAFATSLTSARVGKRRASHRFEHLGRGDHGLARHVAEPDDLLLDQRHPPGRYLDPEIAAGDHHRVGGGDDAGEMIERDRRLDLRDELRADAALRQQRAHCFDVLGTPHERQARRSRPCTRIAIVSATGVGIGERLDVRLGPRHVHALARPEDAAAHDLAHDVIAVDPFDDAARSRHRRGRSRRRRVPTARARERSSTRACSSPSTRCRR